MKYSECKTEQAFKMEWIRRNRKHFMELFCIETEETVKGFPDVLAIEEHDNCSQTPYFLEFKKARNGFIHFQSTQPAFYKKHNRLFISIVSLVENKGKFYVVVIPAVVAMDALKSGTLQLDLRPFCIDDVEVKD